MPLWMAPIFFIIGLVGWVVSIASLIDAATGNTKAEKARQRECDDIIQKYWQ